MVSTHDQVLVVELGQTFVACRFPAKREYAAAIVREARKVGAALAAEGVVGRFGIDFVVARCDGDWVPSAVEINLREGGTSHPYGALWLLTDGSLDEDPGERPKANIHFASRAPWYVNVSELESFDGLPPQT